LLGAVEQDVAVGQHPVEVRIAGPYAVELTEVEVGLAVATSAAGVRPVARAIVVAAARFQARATIVVDVRGGAARQLFRHCRGDAIANPGHVRGAAGSSFSERSALAQSTRACAAARSTGSARASYALLERGVA
jgi:hypothetical protein